MVSKLFMSVVVPSYAIYFWVCDEQVTRTRLAQLPPHGKALLQIPVFSWSAGTAPQTLTYTALHMQRKQDKNAGKDYGPDKYM